MDEILRLIGHFFAVTWWFWVIIILFPLARDMWLAWRQEVFKSKTVYALLEMKVPREVNEDPLAMEQVLEAIHSLRNVGSDLAEIYWDGEVTRDVSLEMVSFGGQIRFFVRVPITWADIHDPLKELIQAAFFSYYPDVELEEVEDYVNDLPQTLAELYAKGYQMWGTEMKLAASPMFPIRKYDDFESLDKEEPYDTMSAFLEMLGKTKKGQVTAIQIIIKPALDNWDKEYRPSIIDLKRKAESGGDDKKKAKMNPGFPGGILPSFEPSGEEEKATKLRPTKRQEEVLKAVEENLSNSAFKTVIRYIHVAPEETYYEAYPRRGVGGVFNQFGTTDMNAIERNYPTSSRTRLWLWPFLFPKLRGYNNNQRLLYNYRNRKFPPEHFMGRVLTSHLFGWNFKTDEFPMSIGYIATLFHPPMKKVLTAPRIERIESKRAAPQGHLQIFGEDEEIEKYK